MVQGNYSFVVPGLMEWYERYLQFVSNPDAPFDWRSWHLDGLLFTRQIYTSLESLKLFLERLALCDQDTISWESTASDHAMYFYPQTIGPFKHMGQFQIYSVEHSRLLHRRFPLLSDSLLPQIPKAGKSACPHAGSSPAILPGGL